MPIFYKKKSVYLALNLTIRLNQACSGSCGGCRAAKADRCPLIEAGRLFHSFGAVIVRKPKTRSASFFCSKTSGRGSLLQFAAGALVNLHFGKCAFIEPPPVVTTRSDLFVTNSPPCFLGNGEWGTGNGHPCAVGAWILSHGFFTSFALCLYQFLKVLLMSLEESKIVRRLCLTGVRES